MKKVVIVGGGPAGLMAAYTLSKSSNFSVKVFDANKAVARKFLVAGHGGFNLTHSEEMVSFLEKYNHELIQNTVKEFDNNSTMKWLSEIGIDTFIGSSGKVFPKKGIKPIQVLDAWLEAIQKNNIQFYLEHTLIDFNKKNVLLQNQEEVVKVEYDYLILALGGASWSKTGSTGKWLTLLGSKNIETVSFGASNSGIEIANWKKELGGGVLKNVACSINNQSYFGEVELTDYGFEGSPIYALWSSAKSTFSDLQALVLFSKSHLIVF